MNLGFVVSGLDVWSDEQIYSLECFKSKLTRIGGGSVTWWCNENLWNSGCKFVSNRQTWNPWSVFSNVYGKMIYLRGCSKPTIVKTKRSKEKSLVQKGKNYWKPNTVFPPRVSAETIRFWKWKMWKFSYSFRIMAIFYFLNWIVAVHSMLRLDATTKKRYDGKLFKFKTSSIKQVFFNESFSFRVKAAKQKQIWSFFHCFHFS